jgi:hypothetical protein
MEVPEEEMQSTYKSRMIRLKLLEDKIKENKKMPEDDILRFGMNRWMMSRLIVQRYVDDLIAAGHIKHTFENGIFYVEIAE